MQSIICISFICSTSPAWSALYISTGISYKALQDGDVEQMKEVHMMDCIECGSCTYTCPAGVPLVLGFRVGKQQMRNAAAKAAKK